MAAEEAVVAPGVVGGASVPFAHCGHRPTEHVIAAQTLHQCFL